jgi:hypothetical protein
MTPKPYANNDYNPILIDMNAPENAAMNRGEDDCTVDHNSTESGKHCMSRSQERCVSFADTISSCHETISIDDYSDHEYVACWYNSEDYNDMLEKNEKTAQRMDKDKPPKRGECYRGLENMTKYGQRIQERNIEQGIDAVIDELDAQWNDGSFDYELISLLYQGASEKCTLVALTTGLIDEREARDTPSDLKSNASGHSRRSTQSSKRKPKKGSTGKIQTTGGDTSFHPPRKDRKQRI